MNEIITVDPSQIKVRDGLPRIRSDMGDLMKLAESLRTKGQMQPVLVNRNMELIAGGRRLAACIIGGLQINVCFTDTTDPLLMRELELEENIQRKSLTASEEILAIEEIHKHKQLMYGESCSGKAGVGWTTEDTANLIGKTGGSIRQDLALAQVLNAYPELKKLDTKSDIAKAAKGLAKVAENIDALARFEEKVREIGNDGYPNIFQQNALQHMLTVPDKSIDILLTDPKYGIDIDKNMIGIGGDTGGLSTAGFKFSDDKEDAFINYKILAIESYRFCTDKAHAYIFCAPEHFWKIKKMMEEVGWLVFWHPIVWVKREVGQNNAPECWPTSATEFILYARKQESRLVAEGKPDWIQCDPVLPSERIHQSQKPVPLLIELLKRVSLPGQTLYDPYMGSGSSVIAGLEMKLIITAVDILIECYAGTIARVDKWIEESKKR